MSVILTKTKANNVENTKNNQEKKQGFLNLKDITPNLSIFYENRIKRSFT